MPRRSSIRRKLIGMTMLISTTVLLVTCLSFVIYETFTFRKNLVESISSLAKVVAANSTAAVAFENEKDASETLASLRARDDVIEAALYNKNGRLFARYPAGSHKDSPDRPGLDGSHFEGDHLIYFQPVIQGDIRLGTLYIRSSLSGMYERFRLYSEILILVLIGSSLLAYIMSTYLQKKISAPILELAKAAKSISSRNDYSVRAEKHSEDELGQLTDTFNRMLEEIQKMNQVLEERVQKRTAELEVAIKELSRSNAELEQFAYVASHDLQEPLRMVAGFTELLSDQYKGKLEPDADEYIDLIIDGAKRMHALVNDLLEYSRVGRSIENFTEVDCEKSLNTVLMNLGSAIKDSGASVTHDLLPKIIGEPFHLVQLFQNLIANAIKFRGEKPPQIHVSVKEGLDQWLFTIQDNGIGIKAEYSEKIFLIFQRLHSRKEYPGTGIGLAICKKIVEQHKGKIWIESKPGAGSTFFFTISKRLIRKNA
jgi:signal transduction histidine kinase